MGLYTFYTPFHSVQSYSCQHLILLRTFWILQVWWLKLYRVSKSRFTVVSMWDTGLILVLLFIDYWIIFHTNNCKAAFAHPVSRACFFFFQLYCCIIGIHQVVHKVHKLTFWHLHSHKTLPTAKIMNMPGTHPPSFLMSFHNPPLLLLSSPESHVEWHPTSSQVA